MTLTVAIRDAAGAPVWSAGERRRASTDGKGTGGARNVCVFLTPVTPPQSVEPEKYIDSVGSERCRYRFVPMSCSVTAGDTD